MEIVEGVLKNIIVGMKNKMNRAIKDLNTKLKRQPISWKDKVMK